MSIHNFLFRWADKRFFSAEPPDEVIPKGPPPLGGYYLRRWYLLRWRFRGYRLLNIYLHQFLRSDDDRALHDHPAASMSFILRGAYDEWIPTGHTVPFVAGFSRRLTGVDREHAIFQIVQAKHLDATEENRMRKESQFGVLAGDNAICEIKMRRAGQFVFRRARSLHRVELMPGEVAAPICRVVPAMPCWTLFVFGPATHVWGFRDIHGWKPFYEYLNLWPDGLYYKIIGRKPKPACREEARQ